MATDPKGDGDTNDLKIGETIKGGQLDKEETCKRTLAVRKYI